MVGMDYPDIYGFYLRGTTNAVNALAVVQSLADREGELQVGDLLAGLDAGREDVLTFLGQAPKWGNDEDVADRLAIDLNMRRDRALRSVARRAGVPPFAVCHVVRSLHHVDGRRLGPTLDGRAAGTPVADSIGATAGTAAEGPTALLNSVLKLRADRWFTGIYNLNLTLPAGAAADEGILAALAGAFFTGGGQELQINVLDSHVLRDAQRNPDRHRNLVVRVAGLNARFVELSPEEQRELIGRAEAASALQPGSRPSSPLSGEA
jgi:formate C-acetyltransferase